MFNYTITGGTGFLGQALVKKLLRCEHTDKIRVYSRDEYKQSEMARKIKDDRVEYWLGDVRDLERVKEVCDGIDIVIHTAACKRMDIISHNISELAEVNIIGTKNVALACQKCYKVIFISSDKAYSPTCIYGASKMLAEGFILAMDNGYVWRFGNFIGSRGSVWEVFEDQKKDGVLTVTNPEATRFIMDINDVCDYTLSYIKPGLYYPKNLKSIKIMDLAKEIAPDAEIKIIGDREGEKVHETFNKDYSSDKCLN